MQEHRRSRGGILEFHCDNHCFGCVRDAISTECGFSHAKNAENSGRQSNVDVDVYDDVLPPRAR